MLTNLTMSSICAAGILQYLYDFFVLLKPYNIISISRK